MNDKFDYLRSLKIGMPYDPVQISELIPLLLAEYDATLKENKMLEDLCHSWMKDYDALKAKYEPTVMSYE